MCAKLGILNPNGFRENDQKVDQSRIRVAFAVHCRAPPRRVHWHLARILSKRARRAQPHCPRAAAGGQQSASACGQIACAFQWAVA